MRPMFLFALLTLLASCGSVGEINADNVKGTVSTLTERVEAYVLADNSIGEEVKIERISRSVDLRTYFSSGGHVPAPPIAESARIVLDIHDDYIENDETLAEFEARLARFESEAVRGVFEEALKKID